MSNKIRSIVSLFCIFGVISCIDRGFEVYSKPEVEVFFAKNMDENYLVLLAYGGSSSNSIGEPVITNDDGKVFVTFTNKRVKRSGYQDLYTSYRSFSGADRQASAIILLSDKVDSVSYNYDETWKEAWTRN